MLLLHLQHIDIAPKLGLHKLANLKWDRVVSGMEKLKGDLTCIPDPKTETSCTQLGKLRHSNYWIPCGAYLWG